MLRLFLVETNKKMATIKKYGLVSLNTLQMIKKNLERLKAFSGDPFKIATCDYIMENSGQTGLQNRFLFLKRNPSCVMVQLNSDL